MISSQQTTQPKSSSWENEATPGYFCHWRLPILTFTDVLSNPQRRWNRAWKSTEKVLHTQRFQMTPLLWASGVWHAFSAGDHSADTTTRGNTTTIKATNVCDQGHISANGVKATTLSDVTGKVAVFSRVMDSWLSNTKANVCVLSSRCDIRFVCVSLSISLCLSPLLTTKQEIWRSPHYREGYWKAPTITACL